MRSLQISIAVAVLQGALGQPAEIPRAPAFRARDLTALPRDGWLTNGGNLSNQRYSPLTEINAVTSPTCAACGVRRSAAPEWARSAAIKRSRSFTTACSTSSRATTTRSRSSSIRATCAGKVVWSIQAEDPKVGFSITSAPLAPLTLAELMSTIGNGRDAMPALGRALQLEELHDVAAYLLEEFVE